MKQNVLQNVVSFILKYIWVFCALLILLEVFSVAYTSGVLMQQSALGMMQSVSGDISGRVDGVLRLLTSMAEDESFSDTSTPLFDRATQALPYQTGYNLYMVAFTDENVNVISADETEPPAENFSLAYRDYMQRLYGTGEYQITDAFLSGDGKDTMNYTIAVPIMKDKDVVGSIFGSIYFDDIEKILSKQSKYKGRDFYLLGAENTIMAGENGKFNGKSFLDLSADSHIFNHTPETVNRSILDGLSGDFWEWDENGLTYVTHQQVAPANWTILYRVQFISVFADLLPALCIKICFYIITFLVIYILGRRYLNRHLAQVNHMLNRMALLQQELFHSDLTDYDNLMDLTQQGLTDHLTGLSTRAVLFKKVKQLMDNSDFHGMLILIDLDDLKRVNDNFGHEGGDFALLHFARILKEYEQKYDGLAARYGGDEFILIISNADEKDAPTLVQNLCNGLSTTITTKEHTFPIHGSLGVSFYPEHGAKLEELICKADLALYSAKQKGKNRCEFYSDNNL